MIALAGANRYFILDEPTNGLDPLAVFGVKKLVQLNKDNGCGALISSHVLDMVEKIADNILILKNGHIAFNGTLEELKSQWPQGMALDEIYYNIFSSEKAV